MPDFWSLMDPSGCRVGNSLQETYSCSVTQSLQIYYLMVLEVGGPQIKGSAVGCILSGGSRESLFPAFSGFWSHLHLSALGCVAAAFAVWSHLVLRL